MAARLRPIRGLWKEARDPKTGNPYWFNPQTKETSWTKPRDGNVAKRTLAIKEAHTPMWYWAFPAVTFGAYFVYLFWDSGRRPQLYDNERTDKPSQIAARAFCPMPGVKND